MTSGARVLAIGGTDSSGGAGLARDVQVLAACGAVPAVAVTAVTAQSDGRVISMHAVPAEIVRAQIRGALADGVRAVKIGMLGTLRVLEAVADELASGPDVPIVVDPVLAASSGGALLERTALDGLRDTLLPRGALITPNLLEAAALLDEPPANDAAAMAEQASRLLRLGPAAVLLKGGHCEGPECIDVLVAANGDTARLSSPRVTVSMRGTGCALASAIAAGLARGLSLTAACRFGKSYLDAQFARLEKARSASRCLRATSGF